MRIRQGAFLVAGYLLAIQACGGALRPVQHTTPPPDSPVAAVTPNTRDSESKTVLAIAPEIREACGIAEPQALFAFDSTKVAARDEPLLNRLATCFASGALKDRLMKLVGHADPRGEVDYNYQLGQGRADRVKAVIVAAGLADSRVSTTSRGENDALGTDEDGWSRDRRVEVVLGDPI